MNFFQRLKYAVTGRLPGAGFATIVNGQLVNNFQNTHDYVKNGFSANSVVYSIITQSARKFSTVPLHLYQVEDGNAFKQYKALMSGGGTVNRNVLLKALAIRKKALKVVDGHPVIDLLKQPNPIQGGAAFFENLFGFKMTVGAGTAWANRDGADRDGEPLELWCLPSQDIVIRVEGNDYLVPSGYELRNNYVRELRKEDVLYWKYWNPNWATDGSHLYGFAPLKGGQMAANERSEADKASATTVKNQGAKGVLFGKGDKGMSIEQRDRLQDRIDQELNGDINRGRIVMANSDLGYWDLGRSAQENQLTDIKRMSKEDLCNVFSFPPVLLDPTKGTLANLESSMKMFVTNKIIPEWCGLRDDFNAWLLPMYKNSKGLWLEPDFSVIPELQEDLQKQVDAVSKLWQLTPNQVLEFLGWEIDAKDPAMNKRYIPSNLIPLDQVNALPGDITGDVQKLRDTGLLDYK